MSNAAVGTASLFTGKVVRDVAEGNFDFLLSVARLYLDLLPSIFTVSDIFQVCYKDLSKNYRGEYFFKNVVAEKILLGRHSLKATMLSEFRVAGNKADCVLINGSSTCYEIKSELDNLNRLEGQLHSYRKIFNKVYVVTSSIHRQQVLEVAPLDVGVLEVTPRMSLRKVRDAIVGQSDIDAYELIRSLRVSEYSEIAALVSGEIIDEPNTQIFKVCEEIFLGADSDRLRAAFHSVVKRTRMVDRDFLKVLPKALLIGGVSFPLTRKQREGLVYNLGVSFRKDDLCTFQY